ncbi:MAG: hypothetical protein KDK24_03930, partial [Pseudooceanicola sp.]|nr:hypothetical protein [Pseudooceanicola sp.]
MPPDRAHVRGQLGFLQWLGALPGRAGYAAEARRALAMAEPFRPNSPAIAVFCDLLTASLQMPPRPLQLSLPPPRRRG